MEKNAETLIESLLTWQTWLIVGISALFGLLGGLAHKLTSPPDDKTSKWVYIVIGGVASLSVLYIFSPQDGVKLIALSLAAGYAGKAVLDALEARIKTALAQKDADQAKETAQKAIEAGKKAVDMAQNLSQKGNAFADVLEHTKVHLSREIKESFEPHLDFFTGSSQEPISKELEDLSKYLNFLGDSLKKQLK